MKTSFFKGVDCTIYWLAACLALLAVGTEAQTLPSSGLQLWLKADAGVTLNGSTVSQWADQSGSGYNASQATTSKQPLLVSSVLNGKPMVRFDGAADYLDTTLAIPASTVPNATIFTVEVMRQNPSTFVSVWSTDGSIGGWQRGRGFDQFGNFQIQQGSANSFAPNVGIALNTPRIVGVVYTPQDTIAYVNSQTFHAGIGNAATGSQPLRIGAGYQGGQTAPVDIAEVIVYNRVLSAAEQQQVQTYLQIKYAINAPLPASGLTLWLKADAGTTLNGSTVSQWNDQTGNGYNASQATAAKQPLLVPNVLNGKPVVRFDGIGNFLDTTLSIPASSTPNVTVYTLEIMRQKPTSYASVWSTDGNIGGWQRGRGFDQTGPPGPLLWSRFIVQQGSSSPFYFIDDNMGINIPRVVGVAYTSQDTVAYVNGQAYDAGSANSATGSQPLRLGAGYQGGQNAQVDIAEMLVYNRVLSVDEQQQVQNYFQLKYNLNGAVPSSGLQLWLTANAGVVANSSSQVSQWIDQSGSGNSASQVTTAKQPLLVPNVLNGKPVVRFDGIGDFLDTTMTLPVASTPYATIYTVEVMRHTPSSYGSVWSTDGSIGGWQRGRGFDQSGNFQVQQGNPTALAPSVGIALNTARIVGVAYTPVDTFVYINGIYNANAANLAPGTQPLRIGAGYQGGQNAQVDIAEMLVYNRLLSDQERAQLETALNAKYGINTVLADTDYDGIPDWQEVRDGTNPNDPNSVAQVRLAYWRLNDLAFAGDRGQMPRDSQNAQSVPSWDGAALKLDSGAASLVYNDVEADGTANINCRSGTVRFWFAPDWTSAAASGNGPGSAGSFISVGADWTLNVDAQGNHISFASGSSGTPTTLLTTSISWTANQWHQICLTYGPSGTVLYIDGAQAATGSGVASYPDLPTRSAAGLSIGCGALSGSQARGEFDELETFNYPLLQTDVAAFYNQDSDGDGLPDWYEIQVTHTDPNNPDTGNTGTPDGGKLDSAGDGWTYLQKFQMGVAPNVFSTPPAPDGLTVTANPGGGRTVSWTPNGGNVTGYILTRSDTFGQWDYTTFNQFSANQASFVDTTPPSYGESFLPAGDGFQYAIQAVYNNGSSVSSALASATINHNYTTQAYVVRGPQGGLYLAASTIPKNVTALRVYAYLGTMLYPIYDPTFNISQQFTPAIYGGYDPNFGLFDPVPVSFDVPVTSLVNGVYQISASQASLYGNYVFKVQGVGADGNLGDMVDASSSVNVDPSGEGPYSSGGSLNVPFLDGRQQIGQNINFLLRAADICNPFTFGVAGSSCPYQATATSDYVYSGFSFNDGLCDPPNQTQIDEFRPFEYNYYLKYFAYQTSPFDINGNFANGISYQQIFPAHFEWVIGNGANVFPTYNYVNNPNTATLSPILDAASSQWINLQDVFGIAYDVNIVGNGDSCDGIPYGSLNAAVKNIYGLTYNSLLVAPADNSAPSTFGPGQQISVSGYLFRNVQQPVLNTVGFYFARPGIDPLPGEPAFTVNAVTPAPIIATAGRPFVLTAWAKQAIANGYANKFAYPQLYFDKAYKCDANGNATTTQTGILSEYGDFFPTEPGMVMLTTKPDAVTGQSGQCLIYVLKMEIDVNHDGTMDGTFTGPDNTTPGSPFQFWINNNYDRGHNVDCLPLCDWEQDDVPSDDKSAESPFNPGAPTPDCEIRTGIGTYVITCRKDLEDYTRLWLPGVAALYQTYPNLSFTLSVRNNDQVDGPAINPFQAYEWDGGTKYLTDVATANHQIDGAIVESVGRVSPLVPTVSLNDFFSRVHAATDYFIFCGARRGKGELVLQIKDQHGNLLAETSAWLQLKDIREMYERYTVGENPGATPYSGAIRAGEDMPAGVPLFKYPASTDPTTPYILFVHGWNMTRPLKDIFANTVYKRLYWQGYQGRFGLFRWPTKNQFPFGELSAQAIDPDNFDDSEFVAWQSGAPLRNLLTGLQTQYPGHLHMFAHSHGNIAAAEALRTNVKLVETYVAMQAAVPSHAYDPSTLNRSLGPGGIFDNGTPERTAQYWTAGSPCYFNAIAGAGTFVDFFNPGDWALHIWEKDQNLKPDRGYQWIQQPEIYYYAPQGRTFTFPNGTYEIFSYITEARCYAVGEQVNVGGVFNKSKQVNLSLSPYNLDTTHKSHSGEFRSDNMTRAPIWSAMLQAMGLQPPTQ